MCVSILSAFGVSAQFGPFHIYSLDPSVHDFETNVAMNTKSATVGTRFVTNSHISPCARLILNLFKYAYFKLFIINKKYTLTSGLRSRRPVTPRACGAVKSTRSRSLR